MKKLISVILVAASVLLMFSCGGTDPDVTNEYKLRGVVELVARDYIEIRITEAQYASGTYRVLINKATKIYGKDGKSASAASIRLEDTVTVTYNGQVMRSMPPQVVATRISVS